MNEGFVHSVRVPKLYKVGSSILKLVLAKEGSEKNLVYQAKQNSPGINIKALYALVSEAHHHEEDLQHLFNATKILEKENRLDPFLARILITELIWGKQTLPQKSKPLETVLKYETTLWEHLKKETYERHVRKDKVLKYARINTLLTSTESVLQELKEEGRQHVQYSDSTTYEEFLELVSSLTAWHFMQDYHLNDVLVFPSRTNFHNHHLYLNSFILLQNKISCFPVCLLDPSPGCVILDACASPGMKTTQMAAMMKNEGTVYAVEINKNRMQLLEDIIQSAGATCIETLLADFTSLDPKKYGNVELILVDPTCSGSGMSDRIENEEISPIRLRKLASFQSAILKHALSFPNVRRVVYSTCSVYEEENEMVIQEVIHEVKEKFRLVPILENFWETRGSPEYTGGEMCITARTDKDLTIDFFIAMFERIQSPGNKREDADEKHIRKEKINVQKKRKKCIAENMSEIDVGIIIDKEAEVLETGYKKKKKKKKKHKRKSKEDVDEEHMIVTEPEADAVPKKRKKEKKSKKKLE